MAVDTATVAHLAAQGLNQRDIAARLGCSQATVSRALAAEPSASTPAPWSPQVVPPERDEDHAEGADLVAAKRQLVDARARELAAEMLHDGTGEDAFLMNTRMGLAGVEHQAQAKAARLVAHERSHQLTAAVRAQTRQSTRQALEVAQRPRVPRPPQAPLTPARKRLAAGVGAAVAVGGLAVGLGPIGSTWAALLVAGTAVNVGRRPDEPPAETAPTMPTFDDAAGPRVPAMGRGGKLGSPAPAASSPTVIAQLARPTPPGPDRGGRLALPPAPPGPAPLPEELAPMLKAGGYW